MRKKSKGYVLAETLIVTSFVAGVLIYLLIQLTNLDNNYEKTENYNKAPNLYALIDIVYYIKKNNACLNSIKELGNSAVKITSLNGCGGINDLLNLEKITTLLVCKNKENVNFNNLLDEKFTDFKNTISWEGIEDYRLIAEFTDDSYATLKF